MDRTTKILGMIAAGSVLAMTACVVLAQNNYPPPQSVLPEIMGKPVEQQTTVLGGKEDAIDQHVWVVDGATQRQWKQVQDNASTIAGLSQEVARLGKQDEKKQSDQWAQSLLEVVTSLASGGAVIDRVRERRARKDRSSEED